MPVPLFDASTPLAPLREELQRAIAAVVEDGRYILGPDVAAFERELADYLGVRHAVGVANGTDALTIALRAIGVSPGDEVVVPSLSFYASAEAIPTAGAIPVFCDVDEDTFNVTPQTVQGALTPNTKAVIAVDLFGRPAPCGEIAAATGLPVVEDAAQAAGASLDGRRAGSLGSVATFSFFPSKNLPCFGDGGAVVTDDDQIAERVRMLRFHGSRDKQTFDQIGFNSRLDTIQAAVLRVLLPHLDEWTAARRAAALAYERAGLGELVKTPQVPVGVEPAWHLYVARASDPDRLAERLAQAGVQARGYYRTPIHRQPAMARWAARVELPVTDELARTNLALPISPVLTAEQAQEVTAAVRAALDQTETVAQGAGTAEGTL